MLYAQNSCAKRTALSICSSISSSSSLYIRRRTTPHFQSSSRNSFVYSNLILTICFLLLLISEAHLFDPPNAAAARENGGCRRVMLMGSIIMVLVAVAEAAAPRKPVDVPFSRNYVPTWAADHIKYINGGQSVDLILDRNSGTGFESKKSYLFGHFNMRMKLVGGDSAGVVTAFYLSSNNAEHDEIDFEFLGNRTGQPIILQTNVFTGGQGNREQRIYLWFDPTTGFHDYAVLWNMYMIVFLVDNVPIRVFKNSKDLGLKFPFYQPMKLYSSLWSTDDWATRGGLEKTDWSKAPFKASYTSFHVDGCDATSPQEVRVCNTSGKRWWDQKAFQDLDAEQYRRLRWVRQKYTIYNYCYDKARYPTVPIECAKYRDI